MKKLRELEWTHSPNSMAAYGYLLEVVPIIIWNELDSRVYRLTVGDMTLKREFESIEKARMRVGKKWGEYVKMLAERMERKEVEWLGSGVNEYGYQRGVYCGVSVSVTPKVYGAKDGLYLAQVGTWGPIRKTCGNVKEAKKWIETRTGRALMRRAGE